MTEFQRMVLSAVTGAVIADTILILAILHDLHVRGIIP